MWANVYIQYTWPGRREGLEIKHAETHKENMEDIVQGSKLTSYNNADLMRRPSDEV